MIGVKKVLETTIFTTVAISIVLLCVLYFKLSHDQNETNTLINKILTNQTKNRSVLLDNHRLANEILKISTKEGQVR